MSQSKSKKVTMVQLQKAIRPLLKAAKYFDHGSTTEVAGKTEYTVEQLAITSGLSVRTIRNYQDKGLLASPRLEGRKGYYSSKHLARLKLITSLIERGFAVNAIRELLGALEQGIGISEFLGVESAITSPWSDEAPQVIPVADLYDMFSGFLTPEALVKAQELGLFSIEGASAKVNSMQLLEVGQSLTSTGIPLMKLLEVLEVMQKNIQEVADDFVKLVTTHVLEPFEANDLPPKEEFPAITALVWELRPLAEKAVNAELGRAMGEAANAFLADKFSDLLSDATHESLEDKSSHKS